MSVGSFPAHMGAAGTPGFGGSMQKSQELLIIGKHLVLISQDQGSDYKVSQGVIGEGLVLGLSPLSRMQFCHSECFAHSTKRVEL